MFSKKKREDKKRKKLKTGKLNDEDIADLADMMGEYTLAFFNII